MKIAQVNVIYGHGSTGRIVDTLHKQYLKLGHDSYVLYGRGPKPEDKRVKRTGFLWEAKLWRFIQLFSGNTLGGSPLSTLRLKRNIKRLKPDVVHVHLINGNMCNVISVLSWLKKKKYHVVFTHHAKFFFAGGCGINLCDKYAMGCGQCPLKRKEFGRFAPDRTASLFLRLKKIGFKDWSAKHSFVSPWLMSLAEKSPIIAGASMRPIFNPVDVDVFKPIEGEESPIDAPYVFFPSSMSGADTKGAHFINDLASRLETMGLRLVTTEGRSGATIHLNVVDVGRVKTPREMARLYRHAKATLILSLFESFSLPTIESILCGTPVVGFECGGPSTLKTGGMAEFVPYGDLDALTDALGRVKKETKDDLANIYSQESIAKEYLSFYKK